MTDDVLLHPQTIEEWFDHGEKVCTRRGFPPGRWPDMRKRLGTVAAAIRVIEKLSVDETPLARLKKADLIEWSIEAGVTRFPEEFPDPKLREIAQWRMDNCDDPLLTT
jgi:hypothetical protein